MGICIPSNNKNKNSNKKSNQKIIKPEVIVKEKPKIETPENKINYSPKLEKEKYFPNIYENKNKEEEKAIQRLDNRIKGNTIKFQNPSQLKYQTRKLSLQRKQSVKYCKDFKNHFQSNNNQNFFLRHLARNLSKNVILEDNTLNKKADIPEYMINYKLIKNQNSETYDWKNLGIIKINEDLIYEIMNMSIEEAKNCEFLYKKRIWLHCFLHQNIIDLKKENPKLNIHRNNILEDSFNQFMSNDINLKNKILIHFIDENTNNEEGIYREWFTCLFKEFLKEKNKLFILNNNDCLFKGTYIINQFCDSKLYDYYEFFGKLLIKAIMENVHMKDHLNIILIKHILNIQVELEDMKFYDINIYNSLKKIKEENIDNNEAFSQLNFTYNIQNKNGIISSTEMIPGGNDVYLNENNKKIYIERIIYYETYFKYKEQIEKIKKGFYSIVDDIIGKFFTAQEFDFEIVGMKKIDLEDWKSNTIYKGYYNKDNETIKIFWDVLSNLNQNNLMIFFEFCTGLCNVPVDGFCSLKGSYNTIQKFTIEPLMSEFSLNDNNNQFKLIQSQICFNKIFLPEYKNKKEMEKAIQIIVENDTGYFGIE